MSYADYRRYLEANFPERVPYLHFALDVLARGARGLSVQDVRNRGFGPIILAGLEDMGKLLAARVPANAPRLIAYTLEQYNTARGGTAANPAPIRAIIVPGFGAAENTAWQNAIIGGYLARDFTPAEIREREKHTTVWAQKLAADRALREEAMRIWDKGLVAKLADIGERMPRAFEAVTAPAARVARTITTVLIIAALAYVGYRLFVKS